jgi:hypothetical protein
MHDSPRGAIYFLHNLYIPHPPVDCPIASPFASIAIVTPTGHQEGDVVAHVSPLLE